MGMGAILVMPPGLFKKTFIPPSHGDSIWNLASNRPSSLRCLKNTDLKNTVGLCYKGLLFPHFGTSKLQFLMFSSIHVFCPEGQIWDPVRQDIRICGRRILNTCRMLYFVLFCSRFNCAFNNFSGTSQRCLVAMELDAPFYSAASLKYHARHSNTTPSHIIPTSPSSTPSSYFGISWPGIQPMASSSLVWALYWPRYHGRFNF